MPIDSTTSTGLLPGEHLPEAHHLLQTYVVEF
jgi:hypothetical protein